MTLKTTVRVAFIDVGQGDTIVVSVPETREAVVIDCMDAEAVISYLQKYDIRYIRGLIITHLHLDHYKGIMGLIKNAKSELNLTCEQIFFYYPKPKVSKKIWKKIQNDEDGHSDNSQNETIRKRLIKDVLTGLYSWTAENRDRFKSLAKEPDKILPLPGIIELIHPWEVDIQKLIQKSLNNISAILKIKGNGTSAILTGDLEPTGWDCLKSNEAEISGNVLKFPHHGAWKDRDPDELLKTISPSVVIISVGTDGEKYNHPNPHVLSSLKKHSNIRVLCTQSTTKCIGRIELNQKNVIKEFEKCRNKNEIFFIKQKGCPCAGTIIIELGNSVQIIQPSMQFHKEKIIKPYFSNPQCCNLTELN